MKFPGKRFTSRLVFRITLPIVLIWLILGFLLYVLVQGAATDFLSASIEDDMMWHSRQTMNICSTTQDRIIKDGVAGKLNFVRIYQNQAMVAIEDFMREFEVEGFVHSGSGKTLFATKLGVTEEEIAAKVFTEFSIVPLMIKDKLFYVSNARFDPWDWSVTLLKSADAYSAFQDRMKEVYLLIGAVLFGAIVIIIFLIYLSVNTPIRSVIDHLEKGSKPVYKGVYEVEFLSETIQAMMMSLEQLNAELTRMVDERTAELDTNKRLLQIGSLFVSQKNLQEIMEKIVDAAMFITRTDMGDIQIDDPDSAGEKMIINRGLDKSQRNFLDKVQKQCGTLVTAFKDGERIIIEDIGKSEISFLGGMKDVQAMQSTPLIGRSGRSFGKISTYFKCPQRPNEGTLRQLDLLARQASDIIEHVQMEKEKNSLESQLLHVQKMESIGVLAGGIAHDFNNILSVMIGFTELALDDVPKGTALESNLQEVYSAGIRAKDLVRQILTFARRSNEELKPTQPGIIAKEVLKFLRSTIPSTIEIRKRIESESLIMGNDTQVHQVFMNLCTNAVQAMEKDGGILEVSVMDIAAENIKGINQSDLTSRDYIEIRVSDTGLGIAKDKISQIFDPYFTTKDLGKGTGMGLAVVHGVVKTYGGQIIVKSTEGQGTTSIIYLPVTGIHSISKAYLHDELPTGKERILFVDDEEPIVEMSGLLLSSLGYTVTTRTNSVEAMELFRSRPDDFDLVITDMTMPNMTGYELATEILSIHPDFPVILSTGYSKQVSENSATNIGISAFIYKPIIKEDLAKVVRRVLDSYKRGDR